MPWIQYLYPVVFYRMTTAERDAMPTVPNYLVIQNTTVNRLQMFVDEEWVDFAKFLGSLSDGDFLKWDDANNVWVPGALVDGDIPAGVMRDAEHTAIGDGAPHHAQAHTLASHSSKAHSELSDAPADAHHPQAHSLASHSTKVHTELTGVTADQHHAETHSAAKHTGTIGYIYKEVVLPITDALAANAEGPHVPVVYAPKASSVDKVYSAARLT